MGHTTQPAPAWCAEQFIAFERSIEKDGGSAAAALRRRAIKRISEIGFPTTKHEEWKYTDLGPILQQPFVIPASASPGDLSSGPSLSPHRLVFHQGVYQRSASSSLPAGVRFVTLEALLGDGQPEFQPYLEELLVRHAANEDNALLQLNTAFLHRGGALLVERGVTLEQPLQLLFFSNAAEPAFIAPRLLIIAEEGARCSLVESHIGRGEYLANPVTELAVHQDAVVSHYKLGLESEKAYHLGALHIIQERGSKVETFAVSFGGRLVRNELQVVLRGEGAEAHLNGLTITGGEQHVDNHLLIDHSQPRCFSREAYKGIYGGRSEGIFTGTIVVRPDAQKTNAIQSNQSLLLSTTAKAESRPHLKIWADDVKCTHGATVGQLDQDALFYLRSRGIPEKEARVILIQAFAGEVLKEIALPAIREYLQQAVEERLAQLQR